MVILYENDTDVIAEGFANEDDTDTESKLESLVKNSQVRLMDIKKFNNINESDFLHAVFSKDTEEIRRISGLFKSGYCRVSSAKEAHDIIYGYIKELASEEYRKSEKKES